MLDNTRHFAAEFRPWDPIDAVAAIEEIAADAFAGLDREVLWPAHPLDSAPDGNGSLYFGAAGVIWALDRLRRVGAIEGGPNLTSLLPVALVRNAPWFATSMYPDHASLLMGELGIRLVQMRLAPGPDLVERIHELAASNGRLPTVELMWGLPGSMLACVHMGSLTGDGRFRALFQTQAERLLAELDTTSEGPIWTQDLYGRRQRWLGPVHGFAGNLVPLLRGWDWLTLDQRALVADAGLRTLAAHAVRSDQGATWPSSTGEVPVRCQHCHGAPGMVTSFADAPYSTPTFEALLLDGGELTWNAGPLLKGSNLCHGTGGNGYAFLKLHRRTGNPLWLERARAFAMASIDQVRDARAIFGRGRFSLWTGDPGLAIYLWDCITGDPGFPTIDVI